VQWREKKGLRANQSPRSYRNRIHLGYFRAARCIFTFQQAQCPGTRIT